ncbi:L-seryl-tRNA(Sec) selenium transferase [Acidimicrobiaceae bacterium]|nr:L-seryl-tRNA(Sec) selenium transferase [Acidimicrobiaceae bacterium]
MENISVNALVDSYQIHLPREVCLDVAKKILLEFSDKENILEKYKVAIDNLMASEQIKVINCTGTLLHTNLGRAQMNISFQGHASNIEFDLVKQSRGKRNLYLSYSMNLLLGTEGVCFVNNNASSLFLTLHSLKKNNEVDSVIISRGEIVEIGGSYRLPEIIAETGLKLIEVGTTNKTHLKDYASALKQNPQALVLKVHRSNFTISGFVEEVSIKELKALTKEHGALLVHDIGSGLVVEKKFLEKNNIDYFNNEQHVQDSIIDGADLVMFSGDKLFGSIQAGIIAGKENLITEMKDSPLFRTYRCSPVVSYELQKTTELYLSKKEDSIPLWYFLKISYEELLKRVTTLSDAISLEHSIEESYSLIGGGSMPDVRIPSPVITIQTSLVKNILSKLSTLSIPIIPRVKDEKVIFDLRSSFEADDALIADALKNL